ncbi:mannose/fructose/sorbose PTS transporter subunit IIB [Oceanobacillus oncorhynchi subsp. oncorhynchi]|uniref:mannose/fructose/sorbose PTS transporter subunit IIB n=1 Tax=Oceanobacillus oncorhynchi TaxID=545501 RepID=UPI0031E453AF
MKINLSRIDDRLIHGQVTTVWTREANAERIIVISDEVAKDEMRKTLLKQAAPPGVKVNIVDVDKAVRVYNNPKYADTTVFLLFVNPIDVLNVVKAGLPLKEINIGGMAYRDGRKQITKSISVSEEEIKAFKELNDLGVYLDLRVVYSDSSQDFMNKLKEI